MEAPNKPILPSKPRKYETFEEEISYPIGYPEVKLSLQEFFKILPKEVKKKDIVFNVITFDKGTDSDFAIKVFVKYKKLNKNFDIQVSKYQDKLIDYNKRLEKYNKEFEKYSLWKLQEEIEIRKEDLKKLENRLKKENK